MIIRYSAIVLFVLSLVLAPMMAFSNISLRGVAQIQEVTPVVIPPSARHVKLTEYFRKIGSPQPERMATAVLETDSPRLFTKIVTRESHGDPNAVGDNGQSRGSTQVKAKYWSHLLHEGKVSKDPVIQLKDTERILNAIKKEKHGSLRAALNFYGGSTTGEYAKTILAGIPRNNKDKF